MIGFDYETDKKDNKRKMVKTKERDNNIFNKKYRKYIKNI